MSANGIALPITVLEEIDKFSISLIQECLLEPTVDDEYSKVAGYSKGRICFLCIHTPLYGAQKASDLVEGTTPSRAPSRREAPSAPPTPSWGQMVSSHLPNVIYYWHLALFPVFEK